MLGSFISNVQVEEQEPLCQCTSDNICDYCWYVETLMIGAANVAFNDAHIQDMGQ